eukprot:Em0001g1001a
MGADESKSAAAPGAKDLSLTAQAEFSAYAHASRHDCWAVVNIAAPVYKRESRVAIDVVAVIDQSGSMAGEKIERVKKTLLFVISQLQKCDRLALVTYDSQTYVKFHLLHMSNRNKRTASDVVNSIRAGTNTDLCAGLLKGMEEVTYHSGSDRAKVQSVLLLTDGLATHGVITMDGILAKMRTIQQPEDHTKKRFDGTVYTFGFGSDHNAGLLEAISTQGGGVYYFIDSSDKIPKSFADCLGGLLSVVGQNLSLKLEMLGDNEFTEVHANHSVSWITPRKSCEVPLGDIQSEEVRAVVLQLVLPALAAASQDPVVKVTLTYFNVISSKTEIVSSELIVNRSDANPGDPDTNMDQQRNRITTANALKQAQALANAGNLDGARSLLNETIVQIEKSVSSQSNLSKALVIDLKKTLTSLQSHEEYHSYGQQYLCSKAQSHFQQRSNSVDEEVGCYTNTAKTECREYSKMY